MRNGIEEKSTNHHKKISGIILSKKCNSMTLCIYMVWLLKITFYNKEFNISLGDYGFSEYMTVGGDCYRVELNLKR